jgi:hypothetical protein
VLQLQSFLDNGAQVWEPFDQLELLGLAFLPPADKLDADVADRLARTLTPLVGSARSQVGGRRHSAATTYIPRRSLAVHTTRSSSVAVT